MAEAGVPESERFRDELVALEAEARQARERLAVAEVRAKEAREGLAVAEVRAKEARDMLRVAESERSEARAASDQERAARAEDEVRWAGQAAVEAAQEVRALRARVHELEGTSRPARKNIYITAEARQVWERAEQLAGDSLSSLLTELLTGFVAGKQAAREGWERIVVDLPGNPPTSPPKAAFWGRWVISPDQPYPHDGYYLALAMTRRGRIAIYAFGSEDFGALSDYDSLDDAMAQQPHEFLELAARRLGRPDVQELDI